MSSFQSVPAGIRRNNPGNLRSRYTKPWIGEVGQEDGFCRFKTAGTGLRALAITLHNIYVEDHLITPAEFVAHYAPPSENDDKAYLSIICDELAISPLQVATADLRLNKPWRLFEMVRAVIRAENGRPPETFIEFPSWYSPLEIATAVNVVEFG